MPSAKLTGRPTRRSARRASIRNAAVLASAASAHIVEDARHAARVSGNILLRGMGHGPKGLVTLDQ